MRIFTITILFAVFLICSCKSKDPVELARADLEEKKIEFTAQEFINGILYEDLELVSLFLHAGMSPDAEGDVSSFLSEHNFKINRREVFLPAILIAELIDNKEIYDLLKTSGASRIKSSMAKRKMKANAQKNPIVIDRIKKNTMSEEDKQFIERLKEKTKGAQITYDSQMKRLQQSLNELK